MTATGETTSNARRNDPKRRSRGLLIITVVALIVAAIQLFMIQIVRGEELAEQGRDVRTSASAVMAPRGTIVDADNNVLVDSQMVYHIAVNQKHILEYRHIDSKGVIVGRGPAEAARLLAPILEMDEAELGGRMVGEDPYVYLAKKIDAQRYREIRKLGIYGIEWEPIFERLHPAGSTAAQIVGSVDADGKGNSGLELVYNEELTGTAGEESYEIGPTGEVIPGAKVISKAALPGATVHTTLHSDLQHSVQEAVDEAVTFHNAEWGAAVVLDVATSEVLVLADSGIEDPSVGPQTSRAVQMVYEPGSVGKLLTFASALEHGIIGPETSFTMGDQYTTSSGQTFKDFSEHGQYERTATGILAQSFNTGTVMIGEQMSDADRYETMKLFGLGDVTGIELPGEATGLLTEPQTWDGRTRFTTMFGQGYALTAIQAATIAATIANDGVWQPPRIVSGLTTADGVFHESKPPTPVQAIRPEVAQTLFTMMESVTTPEHFGTGSIAAIDGYRISAKTGTSEIGTGGTVSNMVAALPSDDPQIAIAVVLYHPKVGTTSAESAAPLFKEVALNAIRALDIPPSSEEPRLYLNSLTQP